LLVAIADEDLFAHGSRARWDVLKSAVSPEIKDEPKKAEKHIPTSMGLKS
jgi:hypothetical protein